MKLQRKFYQSQSQHLFYDNGKNRKIWHIFIIADLEVDDQRPKRERFWCSRIKIYPAGPAPFSLEVFCDKIEALQNIEVYKKEYPEDFYQHISNAILLEANGTKITHFEAVIYCPYQSELESIRELARNWDDENQNQFAFVNWSGDNELPYLPNDCKAYKNLNIIRFEISEADKQALTERVIAAGLLLKTN